MIVEAFKDALELGLSVPEQTVVRSLRAAPGRPTLTELYAAADDPNLRVRIPYRRRKGRLPRP